MTKFSEYITQKYVNIYTWAITGIPTGRGIKFLVKEITRRLFGWSL